MVDIVLKMNVKTARKLSYAIGHSDEANAVVQAATNAAKMAEQNVREIIDLIADQHGKKLPPNYTVVFDEDDNQITLSARENVMPVDFNPTKLQVNGISDA